MSKRTATLLKMLLTLCGGAAFMVGGFCTWLVAWRAHRLTAMVFIGAAAAVVAGSSLLAWGQNFVRALNRIHPRRDHLWVVLARKRPDPENPALLFPAVEDITHIRWGILFVFLQNRLWLLRPVVPGAVTGYPIARMQPGEIQEVHLEDELMTRCVCYAAPTREAAEQFKARGCPT